MPGGGLYTMPPNTPQHLRKIPLYLLQAFPGRCGLAQGVEAPEMAPGKVGFSKMIVLCPFKDPWICSCAPLLLSVLSDNEVKCTRTAL